MLISHKIAPENQLLTRQEVIETLHNGMAGQFAGQKVLVLIPDHTRTLPLPFLFRVLVEIFHDARQLNFMVALGTHPPLDETSLNKHLGITLAERRTTYQRIRLLNHAWDNPSELTTIGVMEADEIKAISGAYWHASLPNRIPIRINKAVTQYDYIVILGPTFPHEVVGFSGGAKYLFPGISGGELINATHWLGALAGVVNTIGAKKTPVRDMIHAAAARLQVPITLIALVVVKDGLRGLFIGDHLSAWDQAADLSSQCHIHWTSKPYQRVLSCAPSMYDELWTGAKAMYKLEPAMAIGGEVIIYAPHLDTVSHVHGKYIYEIGYHTLPYFLHDWKRFKNIPLSVLAHSTHLRGSGKMENGIEKPNVRLTLASKLSAQDCAKLNLGYLNPAEIHIEEWQDREDEGILYVPKAGEILYKVKTSSLQHIKRTI